MKSPPPKSPERLVQTHLTPEARASLQALADQEDKSVSAWVRTLILRELQKNHALKRPRLPELRPRKTRKERIRIDFHAPLEEDVCDDIRALAALQGETVTRWLRGVILREIARNKHKLTRAKQTQDKSEKRAHANSVIDSMVEQAIRNGHSTLRAIMADTLLEMSVVDGSLRRMSRADRVQFTRRSPLFKGAWELTQYFKTASAGA